MAETREMRPIRRVLVANRGEIARRVMRTCHAMGISTVAVFSDADADAPHVRDADLAVRIGPAPSSQSYLNVSRIIDAAKKSGADAVHPGYGFLSENPALCEAVTAAGLVFIGPTADAIRAMGDKRRAKEIAVAAGVPVVPGYDGADQDPAVLSAEAKKIGFPVLLKASAGGGGKGMRIVTEASGLVDAIGAAKREAMGAFGDDTLLVEKYIERPRHVEIQILGDAHGRVVHLFERECSIQRRHQKIIEEVPSPGLSEDERTRMGAAAIAVAKAIGYQSAGTVELIVAPDRSFYFLEVNTRLQVEHPVTEMVTGIDLVREQIRIARGAALGYEQSHLAMNGAAMECRIYAEDPDAGYLPASGVIRDFHLPDAPGLRMDAGVEPGSEISIHYDPMLAKIITHGQDRSEAIARMRRALSSFSVAGVTTNRNFLLRVLSHPDFVAGKLDTHFIETHAAALSAPPTDAARLESAAIAATLAAHEERLASRPGPSVPSGFRINDFAPQWVEYVSGEDAIRIEYRSRAGRRFFVTAIGAAPPRSSEVRLEHVAGASVSFTEGDIRRKARVVRDGARHHVLLDGHATTLVERPRFPPPDAGVAKGGCVAPMPGAIVEVLVSEGDAVTAGQVLLRMEAMKMEHSVKAPRDGVITRVLVTVGDQVEADALLVVIDGE
jgi:3-methylcrotonyl-CoA carboxylase alpha subunit